MVRQLKNYLATDGCGGDDARRRWVTTTGRTATADDGTEQTFIRRIDCFSSKCVVSKPWCFKAFETPNLCRRTQQKLNKKINKK